MIDLSVIIPNYNSPFTNNTINDVLKNAGCEVEVIVNVDGKWPEPLSDDARVHYIHSNAPVGLREAVNRGVAMAKGKYIMKTDDHCAFGEKFGRILIDEHKENNWVQIPRRYALDAENWKIEERTDNKYPVDYMYIDFPRKGKDHDDGMHGVEWRERRDERNPEYTRATNTQEYVAEREVRLEVDDTPSMQGSCYFMTRNHYLNFLGGMDSEMWGVFAQEAQEIGFKTWLGGGAVKVNKKTWYAHLHKGGRYGRMYTMPPGNVEMSNKSAEYWLNDRWEGRVHDFAWFIDEKFPDMPTWPSDWKEQIRSMGWVK